MAGPAPIFSVIIPTYDRWPRLIECVESVRAQTLADFELLLVDDGGSDDTFTLAAEHWANDPRLQVLQRENGGCGAARNTALEVAKGTWAAFLDSDDLWDPGYLASQHALSEREPDADVLIGNVRYVGEWVHDFTDMMSIDTWRMPDSMAALRSRTAWAQPSGLIVRMDVMKAARFCEDRVAAEDLELYYRLVIAGHRFAKNEEALVQYRRFSSDETQITQDRDLSLYASLEIHRRFAKQLGLPFEDELPHARYRARWLASQGRWREARSSFWRWWRRRPDSTKALRGLLRSLVARR